MATATSEPKFTGAEFAKFLREYCTYFPGFEAWLRRLQKTRVEEAIAKHADASGDAREAAVSEAEKGILKGWRQTLSDFEYVELGTVLDQIRSGKLPVIEPHEYPEFGVKFRALASQWRYERKRKQEMQESAAAPHVLQKTELNLAHGFIVSHRVWGIGKESGWDDATCEKTAKAFAILLDNPTAAERAKTTEHLREVGLWERFEELTRPAGPGDEVGFFQQVEADAEDEA